MGEGIYIRIPNGAIMKFGLMETYREFQSMSASIQTPKNVITRTEFNAYGRRI